MAKFMGIARVQNGTLAAVRVPEYFRGQPQSLLCLQGVTAAARCAIGDLPQQMRFIHGYYYACVSEIGYRLGSPDVPPTLTVVVKPADYINYLRFPPASRDEQKTYPLRVVLAEVPDACDQAPSGGSTDGSAPRSVWDALSGLLSDRTPTPASRPRLRLFVARSLSSRDEGTEKAATFEYRVAAEFDSLGADESPGLSERFLARWRPGT